MHGFPQSPSLIKWRHLIREAKTRLTCISHENLCVMCYKNLLIFLMLEVAHSIMFTIMIFKHFRVDLELMKDLHFYIMNSTVVVSKMM